MEAACRRAPLWLPLREAANALGTTSDALRRALERHATIAPDGVIEARLDGVRARKFSGRWRVFLAAWAEPLDSADDARQAARSRPKHAIRPGKDVPA